MDRRSLFRSGAGLAAAVAFPELAAAATTSPAARAPLSMRADGLYDTVALAKDSWTLGVAQSRVVAVDATSLASAARTRRANIDHMCDLIDYSVGFAGGKDMLFFHEFPLTGYNLRWTLKEARRAAIEIPGAEIEILSRKAREKGTWLVFGSYVNDPDWPDSLISMTTIIDAQGQIVDKQWKARNIKGAFGGSIELYTTTIYDVLDRYTEMYGVDRVVPIARTPLGNIATSSVQREPELFRAMAMKGAEVILRTATGGFSELDVSATSFYNQVYTAVCNNAVSPNNGLYFEDVGGGGSAIYGPDGKAIDTPAGAFETLVSARIPIKDFRSRHRQPLVHTELVLPVYEAYRSKYPPGIFTPYQPGTLEDAGRYVRDKSRWK